MDRNHNTMVAGDQEMGVRGDQCCARPGCSNRVTKAADGTMSTYCSSQCVMGQCRSASLSLIVINKINYSLITEMLTKDGSNSIVDHSNNNSQNPL